MSRLQSTSDYEREIADLDRMIAQAAEVADQHENDFATELTLQSLIARRDALRGELEAKGDDDFALQEFDVVFEGEPVRNHTVEADFLGVMLRDFQRVIRGLVGSTSGATSRTGRHVEAVRERGTLLFAGSFEGSFGMRLETASQELPLDDVGSIAGSLEILVELVQHSDDSPDLLQAIAPLNARTRASYMGLLDHLQKSGADMKVSWGSTRGPRRARLSATRANLALARLRRVVERESVRWHRGVLDGAIKTRGIFEFRAESGELLAGSVGPGALPQLRRYFDVECEAFITTREVTDQTTGDVRVHHRLEGMRDLGDHIPIDGA